MIVSVEGEFMVCLKLGRMMDIFNLDKNVI